jgi:hypothetical protein
MLGSGVDVFDIDEVEVCLFTRNIGKIASYYLAGRDLLLADDLR